MKVYDKKLYVIKERCPQNHPCPIVGIPALLGNPHFQMTEFFAGQSGKAERLKTRIGAHQFKAPRRDGNQNGHHLVKANKGLSMVGYTHMDLGIAKLHFEIGADKENFEWA